MLSMSLEKLTQRLIGTPWDDGRRARFLAVLELHGWRYLGRDHLDADLYQLGSTCLAVDDYGLFVFLRDRDGHWRRRAGVTKYHVNSQVLRRRSDRLLIRLDGQPLKYILSLTTGRLRLLSPDPRPDSDDDGYPD